MVSQKHCLPVSRIRLALPASNYVVKLESTTQIIDRLLLVPRQAPWKVTGPEGTADNTTTTDTGTGTTIEI